LKKAVPSFDPVWHEVAMTLASPRPPGTAIAPGRRGAYSGVMPASLALIPSIKPCSSGASRPS
jgi:hypothetical protein